MRKLRSISLLLLFNATLFSSNFSIAKTVRSVTNDNYSEKYQIPSRFIIPKSDSLYLNEILLVRDVDYSFLPGKGYFDLSEIELTDNDTLILSYTPLPKWLERSYGRKIPEPKQIEPVTLPVQSDKLFDKFEPDKGSSISLSGAKSFRFSARSTGSSEFGQTLDLKISGNISENVSISGSVSDRGIDPTYGNSNNRLSELDKIHLTLSSPNLIAQVGDITYKETFVNARQKEMTGASFNLNFPNWFLSGTAARSKGSFQSVTFLGQDRFQGPYQITVNGQANPVVPGSETVWLDGRKKERGGNKDYTIDYPTGRITFTVNNPIDARSRIEIDFEPQAIEFKQELLAASSGINLSDSLFFFSVGAVREGDDKDQFVDQELSVTDQNLLVTTGDQVAFRSGVIADTNGNYILLIDSLPDSVYQYVGNSQGDYSITFSFVGKSQGDYSFLGSNVYRYEGKGIGDYLPVVFIEAPRQVNNYRAYFGSRNNIINEINVDLQTTDNDKNILSDINDDDNIGHYYDFNIKRDINTNTSPGFIRYRQRYREAEFISRNRLNNADFLRDYLLPFKIDTLYDELLQDANVTVEPISKIKLNSRYSHLKYRKHLNSDLYSGDIDFNPNDVLSIRSGFNIVNTKSSIANNTGKGESETYDFGVRLGKVDRFNLNADFQYDNRRNKYSMEDKGTRYNRLNIGIFSKNGSLQYEYFDEDTLDGAWLENLKRNRISIASENRIKNYRYNAILAYQWLDQENSREKSFLSRILVNYNNHKNNLRWNSSFTLSDELRNSRGITYLQVDPGQGDFRKENDIFIPDSDGDYIQVDEILSNSARVRRGDKSFMIYKKYGFATIRFTSRIEEELSENGKRTLLWVLPFYTDESEPYLFFNRRYNGSMQFVPWEEFYAIEISFSSSIEKRELNSATLLQKDDNTAIVLRQAYQSLRFEQIIAYFRSDRDAIFAASGDVNGIRILNRIKKIFSSGEYSIAGSARIVSNDNNEKSKQYAIITDSRFNVFGNGELRFTIESYLQDFDNLISMPTYQLTDGKFGKKGAIWTVSFRYGIKNNTKLNFTFKGRHNDIDRARVTMRGEMVTLF